MFSQRFFVLTWCEICHATQHNILFYFSFVLLSKHLPIS